MADTSSRLVAFLDEEYRAADHAARSGAIGEAWHRLERAHVVAQTRLGPHLYAHWKMLFLAMRTRDVREACGQLVRLALAPFGHLTGRLPLGNTGRSNISAFAPRDIPPDFLAILDPKAD